MRQRHDGGFDVVISWTRLLGTARVTIHTQDQALADSVDTESFVLTHEFLSHMLGAERPSVTLAAGGLQKRGLITYRRGSVQVKDRPGLERAACECYGIVRREASRLMEDGRPA